MNNQILENKVDQITEQISYYQSDEFYPLINFHISTNLKKKNNVLHTGAFIFSNIILNTSTTNVGKNSTTNTSNDRAVKRSLVLVECQSIVQFTFVIKMHVCIYLIVKCERGDNKFLSSFLSKPTAYLYSILRNQNFLNILQGFRRLFKQMGFSNYAFWNKGGVTLLCQDSDQDFCLLCTTWSCCKQSG